MVPCSDAASSGLSSLFHVIGWVELLQVHKFVLVAQFATG